MQILLSVVLEQCPAVIWGTYSFIFHNVTSIISCWRLWSRIFIPDENNRIRPQGFRKLLSYSSSATHIQTPCWWFSCPEENILLLPQTCLLALCHLQVMIKLQQKDFFLISQVIVCSLDSPPFVLSFNLDKVEKCF